MKQMPSTISVNRRGPSLSVMGIFPCLSPFPYISIRIPDNGYRGKRRQTDLMLLISLSRWLSLCWAVPPEAPLSTTCGELVGIVSFMSGPSLEDTKNGGAPRPHKTLPVWVLHRIQQAVDDAETHSV